MTDTDPHMPATSATSANTGNIVTLPSRAEAERPSDKVIAFVKRHPVLTVAGGVAAGALVTALLPRRVTRKAATRALGVAEMAGTSTLMFGKRAKHKAHDLGDDVFETVHIIADKFSGKTEKASDAALGRLQKFGTLALAAVASARRSAEKNAVKLGDAAADGTHKLADLTDGLAKDLKKKVKR